MNMLLKQHSSLKRQSTCNLTVSYLPSRLQPLHAYIHMLMFFSLLNLQGTAAVLLAQAMSLAQRPKKEQDAAVNERTNRHDELVKPDLLHMYTNHYFNNHVEKQQIRHDRPQIYVRTH